MYGFSFYVLRVDISWSKPEKMRNLLALRLDMGGAYSSYGMGFVVLFSL